MGNKGIKPVCSYFNCIWRSRYYPTSNRFSHFWVRPPRGLLSNSEHSLLRLQRGRSRPSRISFSVTLSRAWFFCFFIWRLVKHQRFPSQSEIFHFSRPIFCLLRSGKISQTWCPWQESLIWTLFWQDSEYHETEGPEYEVVNISPVALEVLDKLEDKLKEAIMRHDNGINIKEGILEFGHIFLKTFSPRPSPV